MLVRNCFVLKADNVGTFRISQYRNSNVWLLANNGLQDNGLLRQLCGRGENQLPILHMQINNSMSLQM